MDPIAQWILFGLGVVLVIVGFGVMIWGIVQKRSNAGLVQDTATLLQRIAELFDAFGRYFGPSVAVRVGWACVVVGLVLIFGPMFIPVKHA